MTYGIEYTTAAARQIRKLPRPARDRVVDAIEDLSDEPRPHGSKKLADQDAWRVRIGDYRVLYEINDGALIITVVRAAHRREVYDR